MTGSMWIVMTGVNNIWFYDCSTGSNFSHQINLWGQKKSQLINLMYINFPESLLSYVEIKPGCGLISFSSEFFFVNQCLLFWGDMIMEPLKNSK